MIGPTPDAIFAWQVLDPADGRWGVISARVVGPMGPMDIVLVTRDRAMVDRMREVAREHARASGHQVRLHRFVPDESFEELL